MEVIRCGPLTLTGDFDSGNLGHAVLVERNQGDNNEPVPGNFCAGLDYDYELDIWTKPDCAGTKYQNGNRTWFYFGISGGRPNGVLLLRILNLNKQNKLFEQGMQPVFCMIPERPKWERIKHRVSIVDQNVKESCGICFRQKLPMDPKTSTLFIAFTYPFSYSNLIDWLENVDSLYLQSPTTDRALFQTTNIYYHRECVCHSLEGRRVELITISGPEGRMSTREEYLCNLFPFRHEPRPYKFKKKVVFLSSRVHPGEVPAQFVMNGIIKFLLEEGDPRAAMLRKLFVFKIIPILNPDGVYHGSYRTDPRGVNLNRVYLKPSPFLHPSIYAARKLILYAHYGYDTADPYEYEFETEGESQDECQPINSETDTEALKPEATKSDVENRNTVQEPLGTRLCAGCIDESNPVEATEDSIVKDDNEDSCQSNKIDDENTPELGLSHGSHGPSPYEQHQCTFESCDEDSIIDYHDMKKVPAPREMETVYCGADDMSSSSSAASVPAKVSPPSLSSRHVPIPKRAYAGDATKVQSIAKGSQPQSPSHSIRCSAEVDSGLFLYVDMHGHASKRGIFMYGNHFPDLSVQTECMLLPRLMALNSQHFDFSACNFTERLMKLKDRRDGASREGSGRVAVLKLTGLIRSYTLECNYNTGRLVNHIIQQDNVPFTDPPPIHVHHTPKFTPELFEGVGKSLGEAILDLTGINPWTRLRSTEFRTLDGLRCFLRRRIQFNADYLSASTPLRKSSSLHDDTTAVGNIKEIASPVPGTSKNNQGTNFRKNTSKKIGAGSSKGGPLIPKKENQSLTGGGAQSKSKSAKTKKSYIKPTSSSNAKSKLGSFKEILKEGVGLLANEPSSTTTPSSVSSPVVNRPTHNKIVKLKKKSKKKKLASK